MNLNLLSLVQLALTLLSATLPQLREQKGAGANVDTAIEGIQNAIAELQKVHDTPVTHEQLQSLKVPQLW